MRHLRFGSLASGLVGFVFLLLFLLGVSQEAQANGWKILKLEVAQDAAGTAALNFPGDPMFPPPRGSTGVINGKVYRPGAILDDGSVDPNAVSIGTWRCAFQVMDPDPDDPSIIAAATYYFFLDPNGDGKGSRLFVVGLNRHSVGNDPIALAVVGGTKRYRAAAGEVIEEVLGANASGGLNLLYTFKIEKRNYKRQGRGHH